MYLSGPDKVMFHHLRYFYPRYPDVVHKLQNNYELPWSQI